MTWIDWTERRPTEAKWYWWRTPARNHGGLELQMEFAAVMSLHGMGWEPSELWPEKVSHWDGYRRTAPAGLQWLEGVEVEKPPTYSWEKPPVRFPGLTLSPCPFCGSVPKVSAWERPQSGGAYLCGDRIHRANYFKIQCCLFPSLESFDFARLVKLWETRKPQRLEDVPLEQEIGFRGQVHTRHGWVHMRGDDKVTKGETPKRLMTICQEMADVTGNPTRIIEYIPVLHSEYVPQPEAVTE